MEPIILNANIGGINFLISIPEFNNMKIMGRLINKDNMEITINVL